MVESKISAADKSRSSVTFWRYTHISCSNGTHISTCWCCITLVGCSCGTTGWVNVVTLYWYSLVYLAGIILQLYTRNRVAGKAEVIYCSSLIHAHKL